MRSLSLRWLRLVGNRYFDGEANASVELTPNMAGPAFDALEKYKKDGTMPEKLTLTKSTLYLPDTAKEELEKKKNMGY